MNSTAVPIFCSSGSVKIGNLSITRHQVPVTPAWAITDYKVQGATCKAVTLDLHWQNISSKDGSSHKRYCSSYVQLTRVPSLQDLSLLQPITLKDFNHKPDRLLVIEDQRIAELAMSTDTTWKQIESSAEFTYGRGSWRAADDHRYTVADRNSICIYVILIENMMWTIQISFHS